MLKEEIDITLRPWIALSLEPIFETKLIVTIKNHGRTPATIVSVKYLIVETPIDKEDFWTNKTCTERHNDKIIIMPDSEISLNYEYKISEVNINQFALLVEYIYSNNKNGLYGVLYERDIKTLILAKKEEKVK